ncbi:MAG: BrnT family toxin [Anaerolineae bacterium]|nr:BrnT family toxin [Anaerolineae bacterium]
MNVQWDPAKARANREKHGVAFPDAEAVLYDAQAITRDDDSIDEEDRYITLGMDALGQLLVVAYTYRGDVIRLISARRATRNEVRDYERGV